MSRTYSDCSYGSKKIVVLPGTGSVVGTHGGTDLAPTFYTFDTACTIKDWSLQYTVAGTHTAKSLILNTQLAGTGSNVGIGTIALGTNAIGDIRLGDAINTKVVSGDSLIVSFIGTDAIISEAVPKVTYVETYVQSDN
jgi:hypothetical protein